MINVEIRGVTGSNIHIKQGVLLEVNESEEMFYMVDNLMRNLDIILGQEWSVQNGYVMTCKQVLSLFSENIIEIPMREEGIRYIENKN